MRYTELKYGSSKINVELPQSIKWHVLQKDVPFSSEPEQALIDRGIDELLQQLRTRISTKSSILLIVPDHTRKCNLPAILPALINRLERELLANVTILVANGSHMQQPESTIIDLVSPEIYQRVRTVQHDSLRQDQLVSLGETSFGTDIRLNKLVTQVDFIITIGGILYHYFAGFGGGPKMLFPGVAAYESIRKNHARTITAEGQFHPDAANGNIHTNPVYLDLKQVLNFVPNVLSLQVVLSPLGNIVLCKGGPILETQEKLVPYVQDFYSVHVQEKADIVIAGAGGFPSDVNLIQTHKSIHHAFQVVKANGVLVVCAECRDGVGSKTFMPYFEHASSKAIADALLKDFKINGQTALALKKRRSTVESILYHHWNPR